MRRAFKVAGHFRTLRLSLVLAITVKVYIFNCFPREGFLRLGLYVSLGVSPKKYGKPPVNDLWVPPRPDTVCGTTATLGCVYVQAVPLLRGELSAQVYPNRLSR